LAFKRLTSRPIYLLLRLRYILLEIYNYFTKAIPIFKLELYNLKFFGLFEGLRVQKNLKKASKSSQTLNKIRLSPESQEPMIDHT
jgi:hypothetical protein